MPQHFRESATPLGIVGGIEVEASPAFSIALEVFAVWLVIARRGSRGAFAAGMVAAAAFLTRYNAIALLPAGVIALWLEHGGRRRPLLYAAGFLAPVGPWVAWCLTHGATFSFQLHHNIAYEVFARSRGIVWDDYQKNLQPQFHNLWDVIRRDPPAVFGRMLFNLTDHIRLDAVNLLGVPVTILVVLGLALALATGSLVSIAPFALAGVLLFLTLVPAFYAERYQMAVLPFYATLAGLAVGLPRFALPVGARGVWLKALLAVIPLALALQSAIALERRALSQLPVEVLEAARVLRAEAHPGDAVIARKPHLAFHAGIEDIAFPFTNTIPELGKFTHEHHVRWLFVSWPEVETRPRYWHLLDTSGVMPGLTPRFVNRGHPAVLYEIGPEFGQLPAWFANDTLMTWHTARAQLMVFPRDAKALFSRALVERAWNRFDDARTDAETAATIDPRNAPAFLLLGDLALQRQDARAAADAFTHALRAQPSSVDARAGLGWAAVIVGDDAQAAESWRPVVTRVVDPNTLQRMAIVFHSVGDAASEAAAKARLREIGAGGRR